MPHGHPAQARERPAPAEALGDLVRATTVGLAAFGAVLLAWRYGA